VSDVIPAKSPVGKKISLSLRVNLDGVGYSPLDQERSMGDCIWILSQSFACNVKIPHVLIFVLWMPSRKERMALLS
jgi:hypothetical protein